GGRSGEGAAGGLITGAASAAALLFGLTGDGAVRAITDQPAEFASLVAIVLVLQLATVQVYGRGAMSFAGAGLLAAGFAFGAGAAMLVAVLAAGAYLVRRRGKLHRAVLRACQPALTSGA